MINASTLKIMSYNVVSFLRKLVFQLRRVYVNWGDGKLYQHQPFRRILEIQWDMWPLQDHAMERVWNSGKKKRTKNHHANDWNDDLLRFGDTLTHFRPTHPGFVLRVSKTWPNDSKWTWRIFIEMGKRNYFFMMILMNGYSNIFRSIAFKLLHGYSSNAISAKV